MISFSFAAREEFDLLNRLIGRLLHLRRMALFIVLANGVLLQQLLEDINSVPTHMPDRDTRVLAIFVGDFGHLFAPLLVQFRNANAQNGALDRRTETKVGVPDRLVDRLHHALVPYRDRERTRLGYSD